MQHNEQTARQHSRSLLASLAVRKGQMKLCMFFLSFNIHIKKSTNVTLPLSEGSTLSRVLGLLEFRASNRAPYTTWRHLHNLELGTHGARLGLRIACTGAKRVPLFHSRASYASLPADIYNHLLDIVKIQWSTQIFHHRSYHIFLYGSLPSVVLENIGSLVNPSLPAARSDIHVTYCSTSLRRPLSMHTAVFTPRVATQPLSTPYSCDHYGLQLASINNSLHVV